MVLASLNHLSQLSHEKNSIYSTSVLCCSSLPPAVWDARGSPEWNNGGSLGDYNRFRERTNKGTGKNALKRNFLNYLFQLPETRSGHGSLVGWGNEKVFCQTQTESKHFKMPKIDDFACAQALKNFLTFQGDVSHCEACDISPSIKFILLTQGELSLPTKSPWKAFIVESNEASCEKATLALKTAILSIGLNNNYWSASSGRCNSDTHTSRLTANQSKSQFMFSALRSSYFCPTRSQWVHPKRRCYWTMQRETLVNHT